MRYFSVGLSFVGWLPAFLIGLSGCALSGKMPLNQFESPENGTVVEGGQLAIWVSPLDMMTEVEIVPDVTARPIVLNSRRPSISWAVAGGAKFTPRDLDLLEIGGALRINGPSELKARVQFLGAAASKADAGNISGAFVVRGGVGGSSGTTTSSSVFGSTVSAKHEDLTPYYGLNLVGGYRFTKSLMVYAGPFHSAGKFTAHIEQTPGGVYDTEANLRQTGWNIGAQITAGQALMKFEFARTYLVPGFAPSTLTGFGLNIEFPI